MCWVLWFLHWQETKKETKTKHVAKIVSLFDYNHFFCVGCVSIGGCFAVLFFVCLFLHFVIRLLDPMFIPAEWCRKKCESLRVFWNSRFFAVLLVWGWVDGVPRWGLGNRTVPPACFLDGRKRIMMSCWWWYFFFVFPLLSPSSAQDYFCAPLFFLALMCFFVVPIVFFLFRLLFVFTFF